MSSGWMSRLKLSGLAAVVMASIVAGDAVGAEKSPRGKSTDMSPWTTTHGGRSSSKRQGEYGLTQPRHNGKASKVDGFSVKQASPRAFNPKEFKLDQKSTWKKAPKTITTCLTPDGKRRRC